MGPALGASEAAGAAPNPVDEDVEEIEEIPCPPEEEEVHPQRIRVARQRHNEWVFHEEDWTGASSRQIRRTLEKLYSQVQVPSHRFPFSNDDILACVDELFVLSQELEKTSEYRQRCLDTIEPTIKENEALKAEVAFLRGWIRELEGQEAVVAAERAAQDEECARFDRQRAGKCHLRSVSDRLCLSLTPVFAEAEAEKTLMLEEVARLTAASDEARKRAEKLASELKGKCRTTQLSSVLSKSSCSAWPLNL
jgi:chromosome segregation ATPase